MPDTPRTKSALATLLADNTTGDISPQDLRDFLESMDLPYGELYQTSNTTATTDGSPLAGTFTLGEANQFDTPSGSRLRYTGAVTRKFHVIATIGDRDPDTEANVAQFHLAKNGTNQTKTFGEMQLVSGSAQGITIQGIIELATNDYVEVDYIDGDGFAQSATIQRCQIVAKALFG